MVLASSSSSSSLLPPCSTVPEEVDLHFKPTLEDHVVPPAGHNTSRPSYGWVSPLHVPCVCPSIRAKPPQQESAALFFFCFFLNTPHEAFLPLSNFAEQKKSKTKKKKDYSHKIICQWLGSYKTSPFKFLPEQIKTYFNFFPLSFYEGHSCPYFCYYSACKKE